MSGSPQAKKRLRSRSSTSGCPSGTVGSQHDQRVVFQTRVEREENPPATSMLAGDRLDVVDNNATRLRDILLKAEVALALWR
jgi:hypothetical protein